MEPAQKVSELMPTNAGKDVSCYEDLNRVQTHQTTRENQLQAFGTAMDPDCINSFFFRLILFGFLTLVFSFLGFVWLSLPNSATDQLSPRAAECSPSNIYVAQSHFSEVCSQGITFAIQVGQRLTWTMFWNWVKVFLFGERMKQVSPGGASLAMDLAPVDLTRRRCWTYT